MKSIRLFSWLLLFLSYFTSYSQTIDPSFHLPPLITSAHVFSTVVQPDGKILVAGNIEYYGEQKVNHLIRFNQDGSLDDSFASTHPDVGFLTYLSLLSTGDIVAACKNRLFKFSSTGKLIAETSFDRAITSTNVQTDDKIVVTTSKLWTAANSYVYRFHPDLTLDETYNQNIDINGWIYNADLQGDQLIISGVFTEINGLVRNEIARLDTDGNLDTSFDVGAGTGAFYTLVTVAPNNEIVLSNTFFSSFNGQVINGSGLLRLNADGTLNNSFSASQIGKTNGRPAFQNDQIIVSTRYNQADHIVRVTSSGSVDSTFFPIKVITRNSQTFAIDNEHNIMFNNAQLAGNEYGLGKASNSGQIITDFQPSVGMYGYIRTGDYYDGNLILGGDFISIGNVKTRNIAKISANGNVDPEFQIPTSLVFHDTYTRIPSQITIRHPDTIMVSFAGELLWLDKIGDTIRTIKPDQVTYPHGISFVERFEVLSSDTIISVSGNGAFMFNAEGNNTLLEVGPDTDVAGGPAPLAVQSNGILHMVLYNTTGTTKKYINRLHFDGSIDTTFDTVSITNGSFYDIETTDNDEIIAVGSFDHYGDVPTHYLVKLQSDGQIDTTYTSNFSSTSPIFSDLRHCKKFQDGLIVSGYDMGASTLGFVNSDGTFNDQYHLPSVVDTVEKDIKPLVVSSDEVYLLSTFHRSDKAEPSFALKLAFNEVPIIKGTTTEVTTLQDTPLMLSLDDLVVTDGNSAYPADFTLSIQPGEHYTVETALIVPDSGFVGTLSIPVTVNDGKYDSDPYMLSITIEASPEPMSVSLSVDSLTFNSATIAFQFSDAVQGFTRDAILVEGGAITEMHTIDSIRFEATLQGTPESTAWVHLPENSVQSVSEEKNTASDTLHVTFPAAIPPHYTITLSTENIATSTPLAATLYQQQEGIWRVDTTLTTDKPSLSITGLSEGTYTFSIQAEDASCFTSYLGKALTLAKAQKIELRQDTSLSVAVIQKPVSSVPGNSEASAVIEGTLVKGSAENGRIMLGEQLAEGDPISQVAVYLLDGDLQVVAHTLTNEQGYFRFEGLMAATYQLRADYGGLMHDTSLDQITIANNSETVQLSLIAGGTLRVDSISRQDQVTALPGELINSVNYFPNPMAERLTLTGLPVGNGSSVEIRDILGNIVLRDTTNKSTQHWDVSHLPSGVYLLSIMKGSYYKTFRLQRR